MKKLLLILALLIPSVVLSAKEKKEAPVPEYQVEGESTPSGGCDLVRIHVLGKNSKDVTDAMLEKAAVHAILFRGYTETKSQFGGEGTKHPPLCGSPAAETQHADYFGNFFTGPTYKGYVQLVGDTRRVVKAGKQYKVSAVVRVSSDLLRRDLQKYGVMQGLNSGWD